MHFRISICSFFVCCCLKRKNIFSDIDRWKGILSLSGHLSADTKYAKLKFLLMYIDVHRCTEQNIDVHWCTSIYGVIWSCSMHFEMFKRTWTPQIMKNMTPEISKMMKKLVFPNVSRINQGRSWELQVIKNNVFEWVPACKLDEIWQHQIWSSWHRNWPR